MRIKFNSDGFSTAQGSIPEGEEHDVADSKLGYKKVDGVVTRLTQEEYDERHLDYKQRRRREMPSPGDQFDEIWKALEGLGVSNDMLTAIKATKTKHPKN